MNADKTMNCPECGNPVAETDQFCSKCFARLEPPGLWRKFLSLFQPTSQSKASRPIINIKKTVMIKMVSEDGQLHEYRSVDELPPEEQAAIEQLKSKAVSVAPGLRTTKVTLFKVKDAQGNERIYHSLDELLPEVRAEIEKLESEALNESPTSAPANAPASLTVVKKNVSLFKVRDAQGNERIYHSLDELPPEIREAVKRAQNKTD